MNLSEDLSIDKELFSEVQTEENTLFSGMKYKKIKIQNNIFLFQIIKIYLL